MSVLSIKQLEKRMGNNILFPPIDLEIQKGEAVAIQCNVEISNQLIQMIIGMLPKSAGDIVIFEKKFDSYKVLCKRIGLVLLNEGFYDRLTPYEYLSFYKRLYEVEADVKNILQKMGLSKRVKIEKLTFSEKKRLQIARAIIHNPEFIIIEEPIQNVDIESHYLIQNLITNLIEQGKAVLITTSNLENAVMMTDKVYILNSDGLKKIDMLDEEEKQNEENTEVGMVHESVVSTQEEISEKEALERATPFRFEKIPAKVNDKIILLDPTEIDYIESNDGISHLHVKGEVFPCTYSLNQLFERLYPFGFFRCHRSYIVNLQKVREVITWTRNSYSLILEDSKKSSVPLSKGKLNELKEIIGI